MTWQRLIAVSILCCLGTTANVLAQSRPLRQTQHHAGTPAKTTQAQKEAAAKTLAAATAQATTAANAEAQAQEAAEQAQSEAQAAQAQAQATKAQAAQAHAQAEGAPPQTQAQAEQAAQTAQEHATQSQVLAVQAQVLAVQAHGVAQAAALAVAQAEAKAADQKTNSSKLCWLAPASWCYPPGDDDIKGVNDFYGMANNYTYLSQVKSIYNGASGATTVSADLASLNFLRGPQLVVGTNVQAGATTPANVSTGSAPTLAPTSAAQATQNMIFGGTFDAALLFPLIYHGMQDATSPGGVIFSMDAVGRGGVDIQNFKSGTSVTVANPPTHANVGLESYLQFNSANVAEATNDILGDAFVGGRYGYNYASHGYARDYGFGNRVSSGVGQLLIGVMLNKVATISISRGFGPSQVYIDSTSGSMLPTTVNHFKAWSFGLTYQTPSKATTP